MPDRSEHYDAEYERLLNHAEDLYEFHPEAFASLTAEDQEALATYFLVGREMPTDVFEWRAQVVAERPDIVAEAAAALQRFESAIG